MAVADYFYNGLILKLKNSKGFLTLFPEFCMIYRHKTQKYPVLCE